MMHCSSGSSTQAGTGCTGLQLIGTAQVWPQGQALTRHQLLHIMISFSTFPDESVPNVVAKDGVLDPCCYSMMPDPLPGQGFPVHVAKGFCHEPDHVLHNVNNNRDSTSGWTAVDSSPLSNVSRSTPSSRSKTSLSTTTRKPRSCDRFLQPSTNISVKASAEFQRMGPNGPLGGGSSGNIIIALAEWLGLNDQGETEDDLDHMVPMDHGPTGTWSSPGPSLSASPNSDTNLDHSPSQEEKSSEVGNGTCGTMGPKWTTNAIMVLIVTAQLQLTILLLQL